MEDAVENYFDYFFDSYVLSNEIFINIQSMLYREDLKSPIYHLMIIQLLIESFFISSIADRDWETKK